MLRLLFFGFVIATTSVLGQSKPIYVVGQAVEFQPYATPIERFDSLSGDGNPVKLYTSWADLASKSQRINRPILLTLSLDSVGTSPRQRPNWLALRGMQRVRQVIIYLPDQLTQPFADSLLTALASWPDLEAIDLVKRETGTSRPDSGSGAARIDGRLSQLLRQVRWLSIALPHHQLATGVRLLANCPAVAELIIDALAQTSFGQLPTDVGRLTTLRTLHVAGSPDPNSLAQVLTNLPELTHLSLHLDGTGRQLMPTLRRLPALRRLSVVVTDTATMAFRLADLPQLTSLDCGCGSGVVFPADSVLAGETSLQDISFSNCPLTSMNWLARQVKLERLVMTYCELPPATVSLHRLTRLTSVRFDQPQLNRHFPTYLTTLPNLHELTIGAAQLRTLPPAIGALTSLTALDLSQNEFRQLPAAIGMLRSLKTLKLNENELVRLPASFVQLSLLTNLDLSGNSLLALPKGMGRMIELRQLMLSGNRLMGLPDELMRCRQLRHLNAFSNPITYVPARLGDLDSLRVLWVGSPQLRNIPTSIGQLTQLRELHIDGQFLALPASIGACRRLEELVVGSSQLIRLPTSLLRLTHLMRLSVSAPRLRELPAGIGQLKQLTNLSIYRSSVARLPDGLCTLDSLRSLHVESVRLTELPARLGQLRQLTELVILGNNEAPTNPGTGRLTQIPGSLSRCSRLNMLRISGMRSFDGAGAIRIASASPELRELSLDNCGVASLNDIDWKRLRVATLHLRKNRLRDVPEAILDAPNLLSLDLSNNPLLPPGLSQFFTEKSDLRLALSARQIARLPVDKPDETVMWTYLNAGVQRRYRADLTGALADMTVAVGVAPDTLKAIALLHRAELQMHRKHYAESIRDLQLAIAARPRSGMRPFGLNSYSAALTDAQLLAVYFGQLSKAHEALGQHDLALSALDDAIETVNADTDDYRQQRADLQIDKAIIYADWGKPAEARTCLKESYVLYVQTTNLLPRDRLMEAQLALLSNQPDEGSRSLRQFWQKTKGVGTEEGVRSMHTYLTICHQVLAGTQTPAQAIAFLTTYLKNEPEIIYGYRLETMELLLPRVGLPAQKKAALLALTKLLRHHVYK